MLIFDCRLLAARWKDNEKRKTASNAQALRERKEQKTLLNHSTAEISAVDISVAFEKLYARVIF